MSELHTQGNKAKTATDVGRRLNKQQKSFELQPPGHKRLADGPLKGGTGAFPDLLNEITPL